MWPCALVSGEMMILDEAIVIAEKMIDWLQPVCDRIEVAGSVRRKKEDVKDIELVAKPKLVKVQDMFGDLLNIISSLDQTCWDSKGKLLKNGSRYKQICLFEGINLDLFIVMPPSQWGVQFLLRTGPADFSHWMVTQRVKGGALPNDCYVRGGRVIRGVRGSTLGAVMIEMEEEEEMFEFCGLGYMEPWDREAKWRGTL
jgi:DNA polymerase/3'-5' exonuclease PolX